MSFPQVPVLYLSDNVFYPETIIPLILSDEPSKALVFEAYQNDKLIALFSNHNLSKGIATVGKILLIDDKKEEGKLCAVIVGLERIHLKKLIQHIPFPIFEFSQFQDNKETHVLKDGSLERLFSIFEKYICRHVKNVNERNIFMNEVNTPRKLVYNISLFMIKDMELKLMFLESTSLSDRINILDVLLAGEKPESEDKNMAETIKNFERLEANSLKNIAN